MKTTEKVSENKNRNTVKFRKNSSLKQLLKSLKKKKQPKKQDQFTQLL